MSGWVDSAVSAHLLLQKGYEVIAGFMKNYADESNPNCHTREDRDMAIKVAQFLGITTFVIFDFRIPYDQKIINYIWQTYQQWRTPNPDVLCNTEVKFKLFLEESIKLWCDFVATGHYARIARPASNEQTDLIASMSGDLVSEDGYYHLLKGVDSNKDQSYFLSGLNQYQLSKALFPIWWLTKPQVREIAHSIWLPNADRKDSQWLCFIGKVDMKSFLHKHLPIQRWPIVSTDGSVLGEHDGVHFYTVGQRQGLWLSGWPRYVVRRELATNTLVVGSEDAHELFHDQLTAVDRHWIGEPLSLPFNAMAKIRYRQEDQAVTVTASPEVLQGQWPAYLITFSTPQRAISSGQTIALYQNEDLIASGIIL